MFSVSLPRSIVVPQKVLDTELKKSFAHFNEGRIPVSALIIEKDFDLTYHHLFKIGSLIHMYVFLYIKTYIFILSVFLQILFIILIVMDFRQYV